MTTAVDPSWANSLVSTIHQFQRSESFCDTHVMSSEGFIIPAHACVLASASAALSSRLATSGPEVFTGIPVDTLRELMDFIYTGNVQFARSTGSEQFKRGAMELGLAFYEATRVQVDPEAGKTQPPAGDGQLSPPREEQSRNGRIQEHNQPTSMSGAHAGQVVDLTAVEKPPLLQTPAADPGLDLRLPTAHSRGPPMKTLQNSVPILVKKLNKRSPAQVSTRHAAMPKTRDVHQQGRESTGMRVEADMTNPRTGSNGKMHIDLDSTTKTQCEFCSKSFQSFQEKTQHEMQHLPDRSLPDRSLPDRSLPDRSLPDRSLSKTKDPPEVTCTGCDRSFSNSEQLEEHPCGESKKPRVVSPPDQPGVHKQRLHLPFYECQHCTRRFISRAGRTRHSREKHDADTTGPRVRSSSANT